MAELAAGPHATHDPDERGRRQDRLQRAEAAFDPLPFDGEAARAYGRVFAQSSPQAARRAVRERLIYSLRRPRWPKTSRSTHAMATTSERSMISSTSSSCSSAGHRDIDRTYRGLQIVTAYVKHHGEHDAPKCHSGKTLTGAHNDGVRIRNDRVARRLSAGLLLTTSTGCGPTASPALGLARRPNGGRRGQRTGVIERYCG